MSIIKRIKNVFTQETDTLLKFELDQKTFLLRRISMLETEVKRLDDMLARQTKDTQTIAAGNDELSAMLKAARKSLEERNDTINMLTTKQNATVEMLELKQKELAKLKESQQAEPLVTETSPKKTRKKKAS